MYRLRQMDVDDKVCEQISVLEKIYPTEVIERCVQGSDQWTGTQRRVRQSTALALVLFVMMLALWSRLNQRQVWQKLVGGLSKLHPENLLCEMSSSALTVRRGELVHCRRDRSMIQWEGKRRKREILCQNKRRK